MNTEKFQEETTPIGWQAEKCPRCNGQLKAFAEDRGALCRADNETLVCGRCGWDEATK